MSERNVSKWITRPRPNPAARMRLFCLPVAGGGASAYRVWAPRLPPWIEVCPIQLPGREDRYGEPAVTNLVALSRALTRELMPHLDRPFAMFGHSMGALVAFEVARALRHSAASAPVAMFLAAYPAPQLPLARAAIHHLHDEAFIENLGQFEGTPAAVLENAELMRFLLPTLRADFHACDTYVCASERPLETDFVLYGGMEDRDVAPGDLERWREQTTGSVTLRMLPGGHFFVQSHRDLLLADITARLSALLI